MDMKRKVGLDVFMMRKVSFGWRPPWWLKKVDCCGDDIFL